MMRTMTPNDCRQEPPSSKALFASKARIQAHVSRKREKQTLKPTQHADDTEIVIVMVMMRTKIVMVSVEREKVGDGNDHQTKLKPWSRNIYQMSDLREGQTYGGGETGGRGEGPKGGAQPNPNALT